jgi:RNA polymerase sigma-70 factor (ECF subfamily)
MRVVETVLRAPLEGTSAGDAISAEAFAEIMRLHQRRIYRVLLGFVRDPDEAGSLTQECFLRAYRNWEKFRGECSVSTWLTRIAVNLARDANRNRRRSFWRRLLSLGHAAEAGEIDVPAEASSPEQSLLAREELNAVWETVDRLPQQQRSAFLLRFVEEMSLEEISRVLEVEVGTVKSHLARAVGTVRKRVKR